MRSPSDTVIEAWKAQGRTTLRVDEVAAVLNVTREHVNNLIEAGELTAIQLQRKTGTRNCWRIPLLAVSEFLCKRSSLVSTPAKRGAKND